MRSVPAGIVTRFPRASVMLNSSRLKRPMCMGGYIRRVSRSAPSSCGQPAAPSRDSQRSRAAAVTSSRSLACRFWVGVGEITRVRVRPNEVLGYRPTDLVDADVSHEPDQHCRDRARAREQKLHRHLQLVLRAPGGACRMRLGQSRVKLGPILAHISDSITERMHQLRLSARWGWRWISCKTFARNSLTRLRYLYI